MYMNFPAAGSSSMIDLTEHTNLPVYRQIARALGDAITDGRFGPGDRLPAKAKLARQLGVNALTVGRAYDLLQQHGIVRQRQGSGTYVQPDARTRLPQFQGGHHQTTDPMDSADRRFSEIVVVIGQPDLTTCTHDTVRVITDALAGLTDVLGEAAGKIRFAEAVTPVAMDELPDDAAVLLKEVRDVDRSWLDALKQRGLPILGLWNPFHRIEHSLGVPYVRYDPYHAAALACQHLLDCGYERIGFIGSMGGDNPMGVKFIGFTNTLFRANRDLQVQHMREVSYEPGRAYAAATRIIESGDVPDAFFAGTDLHAIEVVHALQDAGLKVPDDVGVAGYNDLPEAARLDPPLTTVRLPRREIGCAAGRLLASWDARQPPREDVLVDPMLVVRDSTAGHVDSCATTASPHA